MPRFAVARTRCFRSVALNVIFMSGVSVAATAKIPGDKMEHFASGVRVHRGDQTLEITTLRDDVIRVRSWKGTAEPENGSWAVLPEALHATARASPEPLGFSTGKLHVAIGPEFTLTVTDNAGNVLPLTRTWLLPETPRRLKSALCRESHSSGLGWTTPYMRGSGDL